MNMRLSEYFLPTRKEAPKEAQIASHQLMLRAGLIHQTASGIYSWLPLGAKVLKKIEQIIREEMDKSGANEILMPIVQPAELWQRSGRGEAYGKEMLRIKDRHQRDFMYAPTAEEVVTDIACQFFKSYRDLPRILYQTQWKFRDEIRPRFGVMRGREFLMKDAYSFDKDMESAHASYQKMFATYLRIFARMGLNVIPVQADSGAIGGDLSHEFHVVAHTGESALFYDKEIETLREAGNLTVATLRQHYAASEDIHDATNAPKNLCEARGIEVGHVFYIGAEKYSASMGLELMGEDNKPFLPHMGCYGIGVSRLVGAVIEAHHDAQGIIWPHTVAPFTVALINLKHDDSKGL